MEREKYEYVNEGIRAASAYIEKHIYENGDFRGSGNVALVGHSHLDIAYYWRRIHAVTEECAHRADSDAADGPLPGFSLHAYTGVYL